MNLGSKRIEQAKRMIREARTEHRCTENDLESCLSAYHKLSEICIDTLELHESLNEAFEQSRDGDSLAAGVNAAVAQAWERLSSVDVSTDGEIGESFDLTRHECIKEVTDEQAPAGSVLRVVRRGIVCKGRRLRSAQVVVNVRRRL